MKSRKKYLRIVSLVLAIVFVASVCVFADPDSREQQTRLNVTTFYDAGDGSVYPTYTSNQVGSTYGSLPVPTRAGFYFMGWYPAQYTEGVEVTADSTVPYGNRTLYAHWAGCQTLYNLGAQEYGNQNYGTLINLNIDGSNLTYLYNGMNITGWTNSGSNEQKWFFPEGDYWSCMYLRSYVDRKFGTNAYRSGSPWNCNIRRIAGNETDAQLITQTGYTTDGTPGVIFKLKNYSDCVLTLGGSTNGSNVYWTARSVLNNYQIWK